MLERREGGWVEKVLQCRYLRRTVRTTVSADLHTVRSRDPPLRERGSPHPLSSGVSRGSAFATQLQRPDNILTIAISELVMCRLGVALAALVSSVYFQNQP